MQGAFRPVRRRCGWWCRLLRALNQIEIFRIVAQQCLHGLDLCVGRGEQQCLARNVTGQREVRRFVAMFLQIGQRLLAFNYALVAAERIQIERHPWPDRVNIRDARFRLVVAALSSGRRAEIHLRIQRTFCRRNRCRSTANRRIGRHQFEVAVDGAAHHLIKFR